VSNDDQSRAVAIGDTLASISVASFGERCSRQASRASASAAGQSADRNVASSSSTDPP
jgi:hypothetical protein